MKLKLEIEINSSGQQEDDYENAIEVLRAVMNLIDSNKPAKIMKYEIVRD